jgi:signal peptidase I
MSKLVTERFVECVEMLKTNQVVRSLRQFALSLDYHPQNFNDIYKGKRDVTIDLISLATELYKFNPSYIFMGELPMFLNETKDDGYEEKTALERIVYVPRAAHAGYTEQFADPVFLEDLVSFSLPDYKFQHGTFRCFDIVGDSMEPSLFAGDKVVCSMVDSYNNWGNARSNHVYVVVTEGDVVVKRIQNQTHIDRTLKLISDNNYYEPYHVSIQDIREVWHVEVKISPYLPSPTNIRNAFHEEMDHMRKTISTQSEAIQSLNQTVEKLLKLNRSQS